MVRSRGDDGRRYARHFGVATGILGIVDPSEDHLHRAFERRALDAVLEAHDRMRILLIEADDGIAGQCNVVLHRQE